MHFLLAQQQQQFPQFNPMAGGALGIVNNVISLVGLVCFILVLVKMFQHNQTGLGAACAIGFFCCGLGYLVAFIMGWVKSGEWNIKTLMLVWTVVVVINLIIGGYIAATMPPIPANP